MKMPSDDAELLRAFLDTHAAPCPACGYNLRGLTSTRCPECNHALTLRVGLAEQLHAPWVIAIAGFLAGAGAGAVVLIAVLFASLRFGSFPRSAMVPLLVLPAVALFGLGIPAWRLLRIRGRGWMFKQPASVRRLIAAAPWIINGVLIAVFLTFIK